MADTASSDKQRAHLRIADRLRQQADDVKRLASGLEEAALSKRTIPEKWSLKELVCHLWRVQQVFEKRLDALLAKENPEIVAYEPEEDSEFPGVVALPAERSLADFLAGRQRLISRLERLSPADWHRPGRHSEYKDYDVHFAMEYMAHHEAHHIYQMYQRRASLAKPPH
jgi:hypothetical protein